jgi:TonB family protein
MFKRLSLARSSAVLAICVFACAAAPAAALSVTLKPLHPQTAKTAVVGAISSCANPNSDAQVASAFFEMPAIAEAQGATGTAGVAIQLSANGSLVAEYVLQSTGNPNLDRAALLSARMSRFAPEVSNCAAVGGSYLYTVTF